MEIFEEAVLAYISASQGRFVKPQYDLKYKDGFAGSDLPGNFGPLNS